MLRSIKSGAFVKVMKKRIPLMAMLLIASVCAATSLFRTVNTFTLYDGEKTHKIRTLSNDVEQAMKLAGFSSDKYKVLSVNVAGTATHVDLASTFPVYITSGNTTVEISVIESTVGEILSGAGYTVDEFDMVQPSLETVVNETVYIDYTNIDYVSGSYTETIPHAVNTVYSSEYEEGKTVVTEGKDGEQQVNYTAKLVNGVKTETIIDSRVTLSGAVDGTKTIGTRKPAVTTSENVNSISTLKPDFKIELDANGNPVNYKKHITVQATAYTYTGNNCSTGVAPEPGYIAVDPNFIPYGTKMYIKSSDGRYTYGYAIAADTGGFIKTRPTNVDLFMTTKSACINFGRRNVEIYILE